MQHQTQGFFFFIFSLHHFCDKYLDELKQSFLKDNEMLSVAA